ncbi:hypothetical protein [Novacetimonas hansenii]|uniref:hypothetical protein n=1 Tax=Novacetimonas hansenii TaxID=436 RepID=UPI00094F8CEC|nr:hypothetical protein [Novacetimonas hansenii]PYD71091.1 hypothetical protein CFR74_14765 [Novacetimonas hansenii]
MQIPVHKTSVMQALQSAVARGYVWHVCGVVSAEKFLALEDKFAERYDIGLSRWQRCRQRKQGAAGVRFFAYPEQGTTCFLWWLLFTEGESTAFQQEHGRRKASDRKGRLFWGTEFELVQLPTQNGKVSWSWRMTRERVQEWQDEIQAAIRTTRDDDAIKAVMARLVRLPGFKGLRQQVFDLHRFAKDDWGRIRRKAKSWVPPARPGYVRFRSDETVPAAQVVQRLLMGKTPFGKEPVGSERELPEEGAMPAVNENSQTGLPIPRGRGASRVLLIREAEQIRTFIAERWSYESIRLWLLERYGEAFDIPLPAFRERVRRALQAKAGSVLKGKAEAIQAVRIGAQAKEKESEPVKEHRLNWEERRTGRFPGNGTNVVHRKKPNRDELY